jgi:P pilus assembly chaperone PapD
MNGYRKILLLLLGLLTASNAFAGIGLSQAIVDFSDPRMQRQDIWIINDGPKRAYVAIDPAEIVNPGLSDERRVTEPDPEKRGLLVSPTRIVLEPNQRRMVRLVVIGDRESERIYRVKIHPVEAPVERNENQETPKKSGVGIKVLTGYDALVIVRPLDPAAKVTARREGRDLVFKNTGNTNALLFNGTQCNASGKDCKNLPAMRLYAGASNTITTPYRTPVSYEVMAGKERHKQDF